MRNHIILNGADSACAYFLSGIFFNRVSYPMISIPVDPDSDSGPDACINILGFADSDCFGFILKYPDIPSGRFISRLAAGEPHGKFLRPGSIKQHLFRLQRDLFGSEEQRTPNHMVDKPALAFQNPAQYIQSVVSHALNGIRQRLRILMGKRKRGAENLF